MKELEGKVALVTGAASGIGRAIATAYANAGARVIVADLAIDAAREAAASMANGALGIAMDVADEAQVDDGFARTARDIGPVDILVSNAGVQIISPLVEFAFADWKRMLAIHMDGAFLTSRAAMRQMIASGRGGSIILMGSAHSHVASKFKAPYVAAKHGLLGLARVIAKEGAPDNIRSNVICPGFVRTPLVEKQIPEQARGLGISEDEVVRNVMLRDTVDGEFTTLEDIAEAALFLAGFRSNALTGQSLVVTHGWHMQ
ncbi:3-hydroxybutyrate dehydrogenase [Luteibacter sp. UNC138MFCol5.1]|uniref:3-hydroxybutyrate dehydrogenase n=1 Tax=Luteibacter sp. UNC138MFCol5.1 TaxID=1502774 RepID=UPI0008C2BDE4|nr:3-hydroxybutyrate dehydrogenase [Luteibacter sp. UNC138MFCol5.1]SEO32684.1 3-hydroxybutyrate dehydrogenase [Luteibacter sp. UNC138MFCol5.1]